MQTYPTTPETTDMKEHLTVVTRKGQVTIPVEIRQALGIKTGDKVAFVVEDDKIRLTRKGSIVQQTAGALKSAVPALSAEEERAVVAQAIADDVAARMQNP